MGLFGSSKANLSKDERRELESLQKGVKQSQGKARHYRATGNEKDAAAETSKVHTLNKRVKFLQAKERGEF